MPILPPDRPNIANTTAAELLYASSPTPLLYASNRNLTLDLANIGDGGTITITITTPALTLGNSKWAQHQRAFS